jgi:hypothetical protein
VDVAVTFKGRPITPPEVQLLNAVFAAADKDRLEPGLVMQASRNSIDIRRPPETKQ